MEQVPTTPIDPLAAFSSGSAATGHLNDDRSCNKCGYNLRGLPLTGNCSECGTPVEFSLRGFLLRFASPEYLTLLKRGLGLIVAGILLKLITIIIAFAVGITVGAIGQFVAALALVITAFDFVVSIMILTGYWMYTAPDPGYVGHELPSSARQVVRVTVIIQAAITGLLFAIQMIETLGVGAGRPLLGHIALALSVIALVSWAVQIFSAMRYTRWVASRIPDEKVVKQTRTYMWLLPLLFTVGAVLIVGPLLAIVLYWNMLDRVRKQIKAMLEPAAVAPKTVPPSV